MFPVLSTDLAYENSELRQERLKANFSTDALAAVIWNGTERVKRRREITAYVNANPELQAPKSILLMNREERFENASRLAVELEKHAPRVIDEYNSEEVHFLYWLVYGIDGSPFGLHNVMALPSIIQSADDEQVKEWIPLMKPRQVNVCYAQTEIGHGTNLKKLETTAYLDKQNDEFVLNTPTITATKYWPGNLGFQATHAVLVAKLILNEKDYGPHLFLVPLRDLDTYLPLPGITVGDIGPKFAYGTNDNGFLQLKNVRIPRRNMLMKYAKVTKEGEYIKPIHDKLNYLGMMLVRSGMISIFSLHLAVACTISIRYSCVRRQGELIPGKDEIQVLDYQTQQHRIFPQLGRTFAFLFAGTYIRQLYFDNINNIKSGDISLMTDLHSLSSGLKAHVSYITSLGIEQCRMACGGHGYSEASGLPLLYGTAVAGCTYEGENIVMLLQVGKYLLKLAQKIRSFCIEDRVKAASHAGPFTKYFFANSNNNNSFDWRQPYTYLIAHEHMSRRLTLLAYDRFILLQREKGLVKEIAWNETSIDWTKAARAHTRTFLAHNFIEFVNKIKDDKVRLILTEILFLYLSNELIDCSATLLDDSFLNSDDLTKIRNVYYTSLKNIRPQAVSIVDSFEFDDLELLSVLGRKDGNVYEKLLEWSKSAPLNKNLVPEFHKKYLGAAMKRSRDASKI